MATVLTAAPAIEPISVAEAKAHLRLDTTADDTLLQTLILTSRMHIEAALDLALITQSWSCYFDAWPLQLTSAVHTLALPKSPIASVDGIRIYSDDGLFAALPLSSFAIDLVSRPARVARRAGTSLPTPARCVNGIEIALTAGFGATPADVPAPIRHALLLLVSHWYEHRDPAEIGTEHARVPAAISALLAPWAPVRL